MIEGSAQPPMIIVLDRYEAEWLQNAIVELSSGAEDFRHAMNRSGLRLESNFYEVARA
jgi:hypothetical protein